MKSHELAELLKTRPDTLAKKIRRGTFSAGFLFQALEALGVESVNLKDIRKREGPIRF